MHKSCDIRAFTYFFQMQAVSKIFNAPIKEQGRDLT